MQELVMHANAVALAGRALLITGPSGSGKSQLSLEMMACGADLVADDQVALSRDTHGIHVGCPAPIRGRIEARNVGILNADAVQGAILVAVLDLGKTEPDRLPPFRSIRILDQELPLFLRPQYNNFAAAFLQYLKCDRGD